MTDVQAYQQKIEAQIDEWSADLKKLKAKASGASADAKIKLTEDVKNLESKLEEGKSKLKKAKTSGKESLEEFKKELEGAFTEMAKGFENAKTKF